MRSLRRLQADHWAASAWRGHRPRFTRPIQIVISTRAGRGAAAHIGATLARGLRRHGHPVEIHIVRDLRRARAQLVQETRGLACLIGIGGDYTLDELGRVAHEARRPLLPVPAGFGNVFAGALGWQAPVPLVMETLERGRIELVDAGLWGDDLFLANRGFGFLERVKIAVEMSEHLPRERWRRYRGYVRAAVRSIVREPLPTLAVTVDGETLADRAPLAIVANVPSYRGFMPLVTEASPFDGRLDVLVAPAMSKTTLIAWFLGTLVQAPGYPRNAIRRSASQVTIAEGIRQHHIVVVPEAVPVLLPSRAAAARRLPRAS